MGGLVYSFQNLSSSSGLRNFSTTPQQLVRVDGVDRTVNDSESRNEDVKCLLKQLIRFNRSSIEFARSFISKGLTIQLASEKSTDFSSNQGWEVLSILQQSAPNHCQDLEAIRRSSLVFKIGNPSDG
jgi:hypothetical protein